MSIQYSEKQNAAVSKGGKWYSDPYSKNTFLINGLAGSGKTTTGRAIVEACGLDPESPEVQYGAYTGKAASVMTRKGMDASTIHRLIYKYDKERSTPGKPAFRFNDRSPLLDAKLLVLDECSMVSEKIARDLLSFGVKTIVMGDPGQLSPIEGTGFFNKMKPDVYLDEIHRQALDSPIIKFAHDARTRKPIPYGDFGDFRKIKLSEIDDNDLRNAHQIITGTHASRFELNQFMLQLHGHPMQYPTLPGVKLISLKNDWDRGFFNGQIGYTTGSLPYGKEDVRQRFFQQDLMVESMTDDSMIEHTEVKINLGAFEDHWSPRTDEIKEYDTKLTSNDAAEEDRQYQWDFGYAITVHKAQGSQWDDLVIFDDGHLHWNAAERAKWLYTAITRGAKRVTIVTM